jgi:HEAT repeat protein
MIVSGALRVQALGNETSASAASGKVRDEQLKTAIAKLQGDEASIRQGLASLTELGGDSAADAVMARLRRGLPPQLIEASIDTLVLLNRPGAGAALLELTQHRRIQIRVKAMQALGALKQRSAEAALLYALDDPSSEVRSAAVDALAVVGSARAVPALLTAAEREVPGAWHAIGSLAKPKDLDRILEDAPNGDLMRIRPALDALVSRKDFPLESRVRLVQQVAALGTPSARACLLDWRSAKSDEPQRFQKALADGLAKLDRELPMQRTVATTQTIAPSSDPKAAKSAAGLPPTRPNAESRAASLASPAPAVSTAGGKQ